jgi:hypothetical protein
LSIPPQPMKKLNGSSHHDDEVFDDYAEWDGYIISLCSSVGMGLCPYHRVSRPPSYKA